MSIILFLESAFHQGARKTWKEEVRKNESCKNLSKTTACSMYLGNYQIKERTLLSYQIQ